MRPGTVVCEHVSKRYRLGGLHTLRGRLAARAGDREVLWALRDLHFELAPGSTLGLIGPNGAGKTTVLRLLAGITRATEGRVSVAGRRATLIELGAGFHPELSGRENIELFGLILGMKRAEIRAELDSIVAFSGLQRFLDTPVKRYSSGMYVRLAFAVAAHVRADVLLVDEVLAVGDASFRQRCLDHMDSLARSGTTLVFVSHNLAQVQRLCRRTLLLHNGMVRCLGPTDEAIAAYDRLIAGDLAGTAVGETSEEGSTVRIVALALDGSADDAPLPWDEPLDVTLEYRASRPVTDAIFKAWIVRADGTVCAFSSPYFQNEPPWTLSAEGQVRLSFSPVQLVSGRYRVLARILDAGEGVLAGAESEPFQVRGPALPHQPDKGVFVPLTRWEHRPGTAARGPDESGAPPRPSGDPR